jgi:carbon monoxide dehydrogenase subunit G
MRLTNKVDLPAAPEQVFTLLNDVQRVAPCLPGATLEGSDGDGAYTGRVKVKVGPITAAYQGTVRFLDVDEGARRLVLDARGTEQSGSGNAEAKVDVQVEPHESGSTLTLDTDLVVRGKVAQFGRGAMGEVSQKLMEQFARNLTGLLEQPEAPPDQGPAGEAGKSGGAPAEEPAEEGAPQAAASPAAAASAAGAAAGAEQGEELDAWPLVAGPLLKRAAPVVGALLVVTAALLGRRRGRRALVDDVVAAVIEIDGHRVTVPVRRRIEVLRG